jgi:hypothetical protein
MFLSRLPSLLSRPLSALLPYTLSLSLPSQNPPPLSQRQPTSALLDVTLSALGESLRIQRSRNARLSGGGGGSRGKSRIGDVRRLQELNLKSLHDTVPISKLLPYSLRSPPSSPSSSASPSLQSYLLHTAPSPLLRFLRTQYINTTILPYYGAVDARGASMYDRLSAVESEFCGRGIPARDLERVFAVSDAAAGKSSRSSPHSPSSLSSLMKPLPVPSSPYSTLLHSAGCMTSRLTALTLYLENKLYYDLFCEEYVEGLRGRVGGLIEDNERRNGRGSIVVEVAAGDGRLTRYLNNGRSVRSEKRSKNGSRKKRSDSKCRKLDVVATDDNSWNLNKPGVLQLSVSAALRTYSSPETDLIILCSWPPQGVDFTSDMRGEATVKHYIIIGDPSCTGTDNTWSEHDGWKRTVLEDVEKWSICRYDTDEKKESKCVLWTRIVD